MKNNLNKIVTLFFVTLAIGISQNNYSLSFDGIDNYVTSANEIPLNGSAAKSLFVRFSY